MPRRAVIIEQERARGPAARQQFMAFGYREIVAVGGWGSDEPIFGGHRLVRPLRPQGPIDGAIDEFELGSSYTRQLNDIFFIDDTGGAAIFRIAQAKSACARPARELVDLTRAFQLAAWPRAGHQAQGPVRTQWPVRRTEQQVRATASRSASSRSSIRTTAYVKPRSVSLLSSGKLKDRGSLPHSESDGRTSSV